jgi:hypothetical protein
LKFQKRRKIGIKEAPEEKIGCLHNRPFASLKVFPRRLVIKDGEHIEIYDTGDHRISGIAQAQGADQTLTFTSQDGLVRVKDLPKVAQ